jgi:hypothetical protein
MLTKEDILTKHKLWVSMKMDAGVKCNHPHCIATYSAHLGVLVLTRRSLDQLDRDAKAGITNDDYAQSTIEAVETWIALGRQNLKTIIEHRQQ